LAATFSATPVSISTELPADVPDIVFFFLHIHGLSLLGKKKELARGKLLVGVDG